ncbi:MAG: trypsin-like peptidase domain-containing protein, partial [Caldimonas sp.]
MKKVPLYSRSRRVEEPVAATAAPGGSAAASAPSDGSSAVVAAVPRRSGWRGALLRNERRFWAAAVLLLLGGAVLLAPRLTSTQAPLTMEQIDAAMRQSIEDKPLASSATRAYDAVIGSVVRVVGLMTDGDDGDDEKAHGTVERGVGSGVVIIDNGTILTNLHVVAGAKRIKVTFYDGTESDALVLSTQPENDLAVLRAKTIPDDLEAATMRSTGDLLPGDQVIAVGFPFGIGPSVSAGVV